MNLKQRLVIIVSFGVMAVILLFPPFEVQPWDTPDLGIPWIHRFAFVPAVLFGSDIYLNINQWINEILMTIVIAAVAIDLFRDKK